MNKLFIRLILISSIIFTFMINPVSAFRIIFGPVHQTITQDALPFLNPIIVQAIVTGNENRDLADTFSSDSENHFDDCHFFESSQRIRNLYTSIVNGLPVNTSMAASRFSALEFGSLLHTIQDFYAHSNWVEMHTSNILLDETLAEFPFLRPLDVIGNDILILQGDNLQGLTITQTGSQINVIFNGQPYRGLVTGVYSDDEAEIDCPTDIRIPHGDLTSFRTGDLNKDTFRASQGNLHQRAVLLARRQTTHEFCRLLSLVATTHGAEARQALIDLWVSDVQLMNRHCKLDATADTVLIIDSSGSMRTNDPSNLRLSAGQVYLGAALNGDSVGVVDFDSSARTLSELVPIPESRSSLVDAINLINSSGSTNIGRAVTGGCQVLENSTSGNLRRAAILLTDGQGAYSDEIECMVDNGWTLYAFGFGNADDALLTSIAQESGGYYRRANTVEFACEFQTVRAIIGNVQPEPCNTMDIEENQTIMMTETIEQDRRQTTFSTSWPGSDVVMTLTSPSGRVINRSTSASDIYHANGATYEVYTIQYPEAGTWTVELFGADIPVGGEPVTLGVTSLEVSGRVDLAVGGSGPSELTVGSQSTFNLAVSNSSETIATNVRHVLALNDGLVPVSVSTSQGTCTVSDTSVSCNLGAIAQNRTVNISLSANVNRAGPLGVFASAFGDQVDVDDLNNYFGISGDSTVDPNAINNGNNNNQDGNNNNQDGNNNNQDGNNNNQDENSQPNIDVFDPAISKVGLLLPGDLGILGERLQWEVTVTNTGNLAGTNVIFTDTLRDELQVNGVTTSQGTGSVSGQTVTVNIGTVNPGDVITIFIDTLVLESNITVDNTACISSDNGTTECVTSDPVQTFRITQLPSTGEQPWWRNGLLSIILLVGLGLLSAVAIRQRNSR